jgi:hypothetical protein
MFVSVRVINVASHFYQTVNMGMKTISKVTYRQWDVAALKSVPTMQIPLPGCCFFTYIRYVRFPFAAYASCLATNICFTKFEASLRRVAIQ